MVRDAIASMANTIRLAFMAPPRKLWKSKQYLEIEAGSIALLPAKRQSEIAQERCITRIAMQRFEPRFNGQVYDDRLSIGSGAREQIKCPVAVAKPDVRQCKVISRNVGAIGE